MSETPLSSKTSQDAPYQIIAPSESHQSYIYATWLHGAKESWEAVGIKSNVYFQYKRDVIERCLQWGKTRMLVDAKDPDTIYGWIVTEERIPKIHIVHYLFVKKIFRRMGFGKLLLTNSLLNHGKQVVYYTHKGSRERKSKIVDGVTYITKPADQEWQTKYAESNLGMFFNPYLAR